MNQVQNISELLREELDIPVFEHTLPDGYDKTCVVVAEVSQDYQQEEGEYTVDIYTPNIEREIESQTDRSCPDWETLDDYRALVMQVLRGVWSSEYDINIVKSQLLKNGFMHYLNICLTIQFN